MNSLLVSIIIPNYNGEKFLERCLKSVYSQSYKNLEVILIDAGSTDNSIQIAQDYNCKIIKSNHRGRTYQKNLGVKEAKGEYIYFIDSDFELQQNVVQEAVEAVKQFNYDMIAIHNVSDESVGFWAKVRRFDRDMLIHDKYTICPRFINKSLFIKVGQFNEQMISNEDYDLFNRLFRASNRLGYINSYETHLGEAKTLKEIAVKHFYYGATIAKSNNGANLTFWQQSPIKPAHIFHFLEFIKHPILSLGFMIYQTTRYVAALCGYIAYKAKPWKEKEL